MKKVFATLVVLMVALSAYASDPVCTQSESAADVKETLELTTDVPAFLKGATITVRLADGSESTVPAEKFKVVPRKQQFIVTRTEKTVSSTCSTNTPKRNRISVLGGHGAQAGLKQTVNGNTAEVESNVGVVGGAQYQRMLNDTISIGVQGQTNKTGSVLIGVDF